MHSSRSPHLIPASASRQRRQKSSKESTCPGNWRSCPGALRALAWRRPCDIWFRTQRNQVYGTMRGLRSCAVQTIATVSNSIRRSQAIGREVTFVDVPPDAFSDALRKLDVPAWQVDGLVEDYAHYACSEASEVHPTVCEVTGTEARHVITFARDYASLWRSSTTD